MNRDMDLIRLVLLKACTDDPNGAIDGYGDDEIRYHRKLAIEKGLLTGFVMESHDRPSRIPRNVVVKDVTWEGHDFIDAIRSDTNWNKVKEFLMAAGKQVTLETVMQAIREIFRNVGV